MAEFKAAKVPPELVPIFMKSEEMVSNFFNKIEPHPEKGRIEVGGERYMWVKATSLAISFRNTLEEVYGEKGTDQIIYKFGKAVGIQEAKEFHKKFGLKDPLERLAAGPVYFSYSGWAFVDILPASTPSPDENCVVVYHHPESFEAEPYVKKGEKANRNICHINAGYSAGWVEESFGLPLEAREITCKAKGDDKCTFILCHRNTIVKRLEIMQELLSKGKKVEDLKPEDLAI